MAVEAIKRADLTYHGSTSTAEVKKEAKPKTDASGPVLVTGKTGSTTGVSSSGETGGGTAGSGRPSIEDNAVAQTKEQIREAVKELNKKANNSEAVFGIHEETNRLTIKLVDKETKEVIKELPPEKTLDSLAKIWEMAGILVDEKK
jgi:flagellar protein FlaG